MWLLSRLETDTSAARVQHLRMAVLGVGIGLVMPVLILAVQNSVPPADLGTATSANNYFRQIGGSVGAAVFGTLFADRLADALADRLPAGAGLPDPESITPQLVHAMPPALRDSYIQAYADAMPRIFLYLVPVLVARPRHRLLPQGETAGVPPRPRFSRRVRLDPRRTYHRRPAAARPPPGVPVCGTVQHPDGTDGRRAPPSPSSTSRGSRSGGARAATTGGTR